MFISGGKEDSRNRRDTQDTSYNSASDEIENEPFSYDDYNDFNATNRTPYESSTFDSANMTELISTTVSSFLDSTNTTFDPTDETTISEQWLDYLTTISTTEMDVSDSTDSSMAIDDECIDGYTTICYDDYLKMMNESPGEMRAPEINGRVKTTTPSTIFLNTNVDGFHSFNTTLSNATKIDGCVPFAPNRGDDITGIPPEYAGGNLTKTIEGMSTESQQKLRDLCWETLFGQELVKLTVLDLIFTIFATIFMDFFRALFVRFMNKCWCWDLEKKFPKVNNSNQWKFMICFFFIISFCF